MPGNGKVIEPNCYQNHRAHRESSSISLLPSKPVYVKVAALGACNILNIKTKMFRQRDQNMDSKVYNYIQITVAITV